MAVSDDLRERVVEAVVLGRVVAQSGGRAFQSERSERSALGEAVRKRRAKFRRRLVGEIAAPAGSRRIATIPRARPGAGRMSRCSRSRNG